ncbi:PEPxxWA-CTERM sorting domain-containing protein [Phenylobacterium sp.]|uniref:PEPxxWA-CTERM sorting domain-containing protein n=1 Tax=Phenylobacterium sp. TaxID=1871053 RepID=UPI00374D4B82
MQTSRSIIAAVALAAALSAGAGASQAAVVVSHFTQSDPGALLGAIDGKVKVDDTGGTLAFTIDLLDDLRFRNAPDANHWSFGFDLTGGAATIGGIVDDGTGTFHAIAGPKNMSPFGSFGYIVDCDTGCSTGYSAASAKHLTFTVSRAGGLTVNSLTFTHSATYGDVYFSADVANTGGKTGNIGALKPVTVELQGGVPEPATWTMMLVGFGGLGALLRRRRALAYRAVA